MSNWEKEFENKFFPKHGKEDTYPDKYWYIDIHHDEIKPRVAEMIGFIRQREKELLEEVREKIIGEIEAVEVKPFGPIMEAAVRNHQRKEQLKKLKELSNE